MTTVQVHLPPKLIPVFSGSARFRGARGGRGSGKTRGFAKMTAVRGMMDASNGKSGIILCAREFMNSLDESSMEEVKAAIRSETFLMQFYEIGEKYIRSKCGRIRYAFAGLRHNLDSIKSKANILLCWVDEAESVSEGAWRKLIPTIREEDSELWVTWNPEDAESPTNKRFFNPVDDDAKIVELNYSDNPYFPGVLEAERQRDLKNRPLDYAHIWEGAFKTRHDARVFTNWRVDTFDTPADAVFRFGADWGFSVDPSVLVRGFLVGRTLYIDHEAYQVGCDTDYLPFLFGGVKEPALIKLNQQAFNEASEQQKATWPGVPRCRDFRITADSARPETVNYMRRHGFPKIVPAIKGVGSIEDGLSFLQSFDMVIHERCAHMAREVAKYSYKVDKQTEEVLPFLEDKDNHCFPAGTMVATKRGQVPIESVRVGDRALTRKGYRRVSFSGQTAENAALVRVSTTLGDLTCTPEHPVWVSGKGFVRADALRYNDEIIGDAAWQNQNPFTTGNANTTATQTRRAGLMRVISDALSQAEHACFTARYGKTITGQFQTGGTSTISTKIHPTMPSRTWNVSRLKSMRNAILGMLSAWQGRLNISPPFATSPRLGTQAQRGGLGMSKMESVFGKTSLPLTAPVRAASFSRPRATTTSIAQTPVGLISGVPLALMTWIGRAWSAIKDSASTNTARPSLVAGRVLTVTEQGSAEKVYDLTVEGEHEFFADGILVSNCIDALRYALEGLRRAGPLEVAGVEPKPIDRYSRLREKAEEGGFY